MSARLCISVSSKINRRRGWRVMPLVTVAALAASGLAVAIPAPAAAASAVPDVTSTGSVYAAVIAARSQGHRVEDTSQRTESTTVYANPDGTLTSELADGPVRVRQGDGTWGAVDTALVSDKTGVHPRSVLGSPVLSGGGSGPLVSLAGPDGRRAALAWPSVLPVPVLVGDSATYRDVQPGTDLVVQALATGVDVQMVLKVKPTSAAAFHLPLSISGFTTRRDAATGAVGLLDGSGAAVMTVGAARMWDAHRDSAGNPSREVPVLDGLSGTAGKQQVDVMPASTFLNDAATTYPVVVDPSLTVVNVGADAYVRSSDPTTNYGTTGALWTGKVTSPEADRTYVAFGLEKLSGKHVLSATLNARNTFSYSCTASAASLYQVTQGWAETGVTWNVQPTVDTSVLATSTFANGAANGGAACGTAPAWVSWTSASLTTLVAGWAGGTTASYGLMIGASETSLCCGKQFSSRESGSPAYLSVTYNSYPGTVAGRSVRPGSYDSVANKWWTGTSGPGFNGGAPDPDGGTNQLYVQVFTTARTGAYLWSGFGNSVQPGATSLATAPVGTFTNGTTYSWRAKQYDGTDYSQGWSSWADVTIDLTAPAAPTVSSTTYPSGVWNAAHPAGSFMFASPGSSDVASWNYRFANAAGGTSWASAAATAGTNSSTALSLTPPPGWQTLHVVGIDHAGNRSTDTSYTFGAGAALTSPAPGASTQKKVALSAQTGTGSTQVSFQYRLKDADPWVDLPLGQGAVTDTALTAVGAWPVATTTSGSTVSSPTLLLDVTKLLDPTGTGTTPVDGTVQVQAQFKNASGVNTTTTLSPPTVTLNQNAFGAGYATEQVGPGSVNLVTGDYSLRSTDASVSSYGSDLTLSRTFNSRTPATAGLLGPGWTSSVGVDAASSDYTVLSDIGSSVALTSGDGSLLVFAKTATGYVGQRDAQDLTLTAGTNLGSAPGSFTLLEPGGAKTVFSVTTNWPAVAALGTPHAYPPTSISQPGTSQTTTYTYSTIAGVSVPVRLLAPTTPGVTCPAYPAPFSGTANMGCRALDLTYATVAGRPQISAATERTTDGTGTTINVDLACYRYDTNSGRLLQAWDPRLNATTCTSTPAAADLPLGFTYEDGTAGTANTGRLSTITPAGLAAWKLTYDSAALTGRLITASHTHNATYGSGTETSTVVYDVPFGNDTDAGAGLHPDLSSGTVASWSQLDLPVTAVAVFGPGDAVPTVPLTPGADLRDGTVHALDVTGREVNTATDSGSGQGGWRIDTTEYDSQGNTLRTLDAANRDRALRRTDAPASTVTLPTDTAAAARLLDTQNLYALNAHDTTAETGTQLDLTDSFGPLHQVALPDGTLAPARAHSHTDYDLGSETSHPGTTSLHLPVAEWTEASVSPDIYPGTAPAGIGYDRRTSTSGYTLNSGADVTGWTFRTPLTSTNTPGGTASPTTTTTVLDSATGIAKESRMPSDTAVNGQ